MAILRTFTRIGRLLTLIWSVYTIINAILERNKSFDKSLCIYCEYFVDQKKYFFYIFTYHIIAGIVTIFMTLGIDTSYMNCI
ncbi:hypothetical protein TSAR_013727 [Trichomalopsis sarcophagae]|uniref:Uncharacterized protein n=1 Tax=Trichomalopsis sarcophagae TaxID=543379 RepID=A0A232EQR8_9HYME|nr:hypothetical protein TSAR_013727 [Trichomalopsis sarcophagae]